MFHICNGNLLSSQFSSLTFGQQFLSDVQAINKEVETGSETIITCIVSGITQQLNSVVWTKDGTDVTTLSEDNSYIVSAGTYGSNSQTTTLTVKANVDTADSIFTCGISSNEWLVSNRQTSVRLNVYCKFSKCHFRRICFTHNMIALPYFIH